MFLSRKFLPTLLVCFFIKTSSSASTKQVACEKVGLLYDYGPKTCFLQQATINSQGYLIASDNDLTIMNLEFYFNREIRFLPVKVYKKFPNLMMISANYCSIKMITKENFEKLNKLERLYLSGNHIEEIVTNTFEDLTSLKYLYLSENNIKYMNGNLFNGINSLKEVWLRKNECIDENFEGQTQIKKMVESITETCGFEWLEGM